MKIFQNKLFKIISALFQFISALFHFQILMLQNIEKILNSGKNDIQTVNKKIGKVVNRYIFLYFSPNENFMKIQQISQNIKDSKIMVINYCQNQTPDLDDLHFIIGFKNTILIIHSLSFNKFIEYIL